MAISSAIKESVILTALERWIDVPFPVNGGKQAGFSRLCEFGNTLSYGNELVRSSFCQRFPESNPNPTQMTVDSHEDMTNDPVVPREHEIEIRVRYQETDAQGRIHHANYLNYFEIGRVEMLRASGASYRKLEEAGIMLVVAAVSCNYYIGAKYDDLLRLKTTVVKARGVRIQHCYEIFLGDELVCDGETTVAAIDRCGKVVRLPKWLQMDAKHKRNSDSKPSV